MIPSVLVVSLYDSVFVLSEMNTQTIARLKGKSYIGEAGRTQRVAATGFPCHQIYRERASKSVRNVMTEEVVDMIGLVSIGDIVCVVVIRHRDEFSRLNAYIQGGYSSGYVYLEYAPQFFQENHQELKRSSQNKVSFSSVFGTKSSSLMIVVFFCILFSNIPLFYLSCSSSIEMALPLLETIPFDIERLNMCNLDKHYIAKIIVLLSNVWEEVEKPNITVPECNQELNSHQ
ncbi:hypothetical protein H5410_030107 [Solanum commersonii]|uniref:Uncharacterized protein n=1 Tax=Solanum commersonii TaxID=4109 RepID=A0A9J5YEP6_SOLCO|nr:hypothetical protein H5410_030107 [Solanum commersonii]